VTPDEDFRDHYALGVERDRLAGGTSRLEFARTKEILERTLPPAPATILDVGGGPGAYAGWLASRGYAVHLVDAVPLHVEQAETAARSGPAFTVALGDARELEQDDDTFDAVLLLGPLYHLTERGDRVRALREARRVVRGDGPIAIALISRFVSLLDGLTSGYLGDPDVDRIVERDLREGQHRNPTGRVELFTTAYFHHPDDVEPELDEAGLRLEGMFGLEGPGWLLGERLDDPEDWRRAMRVAHAIEAEPALAWVSAHLLAIARPARR
jgi:SAM-dependent methyltransferase